MNAYCKSDYQLQLDMAQDRPVYRKTKVYPYLAMEIGVFTKMQYDSYFDGSYQQLLFLYQVPGS